MSALYHVIVCAAIMSPQGKVLIARRAPGKKLEGFWEFPGGKLEIGETLEDALRREISEELNIHIHIHKVLHIKPYSYPHGNVLILFYLCDSYTGEIQLTDHDQALWCTVDELQELRLLPANEEALAKLRVELMPVTV